MSRKERRASGDKKPLKRLNLSGLLQVFNCIGSLSGITALILALALFMGSGTVATSDNKNTGFKYITCTLECGLSYEVRSDWNVDGLTNAIVFYMTDSSVLSLSCESVYGINQTSELKCTYDTLKEYVKTTTIDAYSKQDIKYEMLVESDYNILDTKGYRLYAKQESVKEGQKVITYTDTVFFIYNDYLCSASFTSSYTGYPETEFYRLLDSIAVVTEDTENILDWGTPVDSGIIDEFTSLVN